MMKAPGIPASPRASQAPLRLVLVGAAAAGASDAVEEAAGRLAALIGVPALAMPSPHEDDEAGVDAVMAELNSRGGSWVVPLPVDPGRWQPWGGRWSELLGSWRQPVVLLIESHQADGGLPAACTALMECSGAPLLGLIQWGGGFDREARRRDGLPWLGGLSHSPGSGAAWEAEEADLSLCLNLGRRWSRITAEAR